jgi:hypothetical protein
MTPLQVIVISSLDDCNGSLSGNEADVMSAQLDLLTNRLQNWSIVTSLRAMRPRTTTASATTTAIATAAAATDNQQQQQQQQLQLQLQLQYSLDPHRVQAVRTANRTVMRALMRK